MKLSDKHSNSGFTLLEIIVTLTMAAIVGALMYQYSGTILTNSALPLTQIGRALSLQKVMENVFADYKTNYSTNLIGIQSKIGTEGTSQDNSYGQYAVVDNHCISFNGTAPSFSESGTVDTNCTNDILKVTVKNNLGEKLSVLLTQ